MPTKVGYFIYFSKQKQRKNPSLLFLLLQPDPFQIADHSHVHYVTIDFRCPHAFMPQQLLDSRYIRPAVQQQSRIRMTRCVERDPFPYFCQLANPFQPLIHIRI